MADLTVGWWGEKCHFTCSSPPLVTFCIWCTFYLTLLLPPDHWSLLSFSSSSLLHAIISLYSLICLPVLHFTSHKWRYWWCLHSASVSVREKRREMHWSRQKQAIAVDGEEREREREKKKRFPFSSGNIFHQMTQVSLGSLNEKKSNSLSCCSSTLTRVVLCKTYSCESSTFFTCHCYLNLHTASCFFFFFSPLTRNRKQGITVK